VSGTTLAHADWMRANGLDTSPGRSRYKRLREQLAELERHAERADDFAARAPDAGSRRRHAEHGDRLRRRMSDIWAELEEDFTEPVEAGACARCQKPLTAEQLYASRTCRLCADPDLQAPST
jgi:RNA polymerase-binding transcription factor DksA